MKPALEDILPFAVGLLFGAGLLLSGLANPAKVLGFLDVAGDWDPSFIFVMGFGAGTAMLGFRWAARHSKPLLSARHHLPETTRIDAALIWGAALFGLGWGLVGLCPGPAILAIASFRLEPVIFVAAMLAGMQIRTWFRRNPAA